MGCANAPRRHPSHHEEQSHAFLSARRRLCRRDRIRTAGSFLGNRPRDGHPPSEVLYDGATGLDWLLLDYDSLPGTTWDQAVSHAPGFRLATLSELETFFAGLALELDNSVHPMSHGSVTFLLQEWGNLGIFYWNNPQSSIRTATSRFWLADPSSTPGTHLWGFFSQHYEEFLPGVPEIWQVGVGSSPDNTSASYLSAALVRVHVNAIPEPETYLLLAGGLVALFLRRAALEARRSPSRGLRRGVA